MEHFHHGAATEWFLAGQQLIKNDAQREDVTPAIQPMTLPAHLFGTHVGGRAGDVPFRKRSFFADRQTEVGHIRDARCFFDQDIGGLHVPVN